MRKSGNHVRITAQLIDAVNDRHQWSETYDRELTDIFAIQEEIANSIVANTKTPYLVGLGLSYPYLWLGDFTKAGVSEDALCGVIVTRPFTATSVLSSYTDTHAAGMPDAAR